MPRSALLPASPQDPTGLDRLERGAIRDFERRLRAVAQAYRSATMQLPATAVTTNARYTFQLDQYAIQSMLDNLGAYVDEVLLDGGPRQAWLFERYVKVAAIRGTAQSIANLGNQSAAYRSLRGELSAVLRSDEYVRRLAMTRARVFEEMRGLSQATKTELARTLTEGIGRGLNPREIAKNISERTGVIASRASVISRTEITTALRRAKWDESDIANEQLRLNTLEMHLSALSPTTRATHAARHSKLFTTEEEREWWAKDANNINCKCSTTAVMVDSEGEPLVPRIVERAQQTFEKLKQTSDAGWAS